MDRLGRNAGHGLSRKRVTLAQMDTAERQALLALTLTPGLGPVLTRRALETFGSALAACGASRQQWLTVPGIGMSLAQTIRQGLDAVIAQQRVADELAMMEQYQAKMLVLGDSDYPRLLAHISDPPVVLYVRGEIRESDALALAIVGSRRCSAYGREQADRFATLGCGAGLCIISGGAYGVDAAAHRAALRVQGRTLVVLGSGLAKPYPADHAELFDQVADGHGAVVSEMPMTAPPVAENFPRRNRIISGLSLGVLVIEAAHQSGALITARLAAEEHHREVMALPGRVDVPGSAGCHKIIREGWATLVTSLNDVLQAMGETGSLLKAGLTEHADTQAAAESNLFETGLTDSQQKVMRSLDGPMGLDQLAAATGLSMSCLQADLTLMEIRGLLRRSGGMIHKTRRGVEP